MAANTATLHDEVLIVTVDAGLPGKLVFPERAQGIVVFAHGSGSSHLSPRNQKVAKTLHDGRLATLLFDLLTPDEHRIDQQTSEFRFDIDLLARRLTGVVDWVHEHRKLNDLPIGLFGASTGAAAALRTAAQRSSLISAVVSRGGRPDLAGTALADVHAPTLLIVGGNDTQVIQLNRQAAEKLTCRSRVEIVPGASHLFEEPGKLEEVARLAQAWFSESL